MCFETLLQNVCEQGGLLMGCRRQKDRLAQLRHLESCSASAYYYYLFPSNFITCSLHMTSTTSNVSAVNQIRVMYEVLLVYLGLFIEIVRLIIQNVLAEKNIAIIAKDKERRLKNKTNKQKMEENIFSMSKREQKNIRFVHRDNLRTKVKLLELTKVCTRLNSSYLNKQFDLCQPFFLQHPDQVLILLMISLSS